MCDYSLRVVASRPAKVGEKLVSTRFPNSITRLKRRQKFNGSLTLLWPCGKVI